MIRFLIRVFQKILNLLYQLDRRLRRSVTPEHRNELVAQSAEQHDMVKDSDEKYFTEQYWYWIKSRLEKEKVSASANVLDLGCGQGRLAFKLAAWAKQGAVRGVDISERAILQAKEYAKQNGLSNVSFEVGEAASYIGSVPSASCDVVLFVEVAFFMPEYQKVLSEIKRVLKPGGLMVASFRPQYFNALYAIRGHRWNDLNTVLRERTGNLWGLDINFTWQQSGELKELIRKVGFALLDFVGIGALSGIEGDPHEMIARPSELSKDEQVKLQEVAHYFGPLIPDAGRYMLAIAKK